MTPEEQLETTDKQLTEARRLLMSFIQSAEEALHDDEEAKTALRACSRTALAFLTESRQESIHEEAGEEDNHLCVGCAHVIVCTVTHIIPREFDLCIVRCDGYTEIPDENEPA